MLSKIWEEHEGNGTKVTVRRCHCYPWVNEQSTAPVVGQNDPRAQTKLKGALGWSWDGSKGSGKGGD
jgi:hypothetical protein